MLRRTSIRCGGFSLVEVLIALGVFSFGAVLVVGMMAATISRGRELSERGSLPRLMSAIDAKLVDLGLSWSSDTEEGRGVIDLTDGKSFFLVADSRGDFVDLQVASSLPESEQFYLVEIFRHDLEGFEYGEDQIGCLILSVSVSWPYRISTQNGFAEIDSGSRKNFHFLTALRI